MRLIGFVAGQTKAMGCPRPPHIQRHPRVRLFPERPAKVYQHRFDLWDRGLGDLDLACGKQCATYQRHICKGKGCIALRTGRADLVDQKVVQMLARGGVTDIGDR